MGCLFCNQTPLTLEHVWPQWLNDEFPALQETVFTFMSATKPTRVWKGSPASIKVRAVCKTCNNGWMSDLEQEAKPLLIPLIRGKTPTLDKPQQRTLSAWAFKTAVMLAELNPGSVPIAGDHMAHVRSHGEPSPFVHVFATAYDAKGPADTFYRDTVLDIHLPPESGYPREAYVSTLAIRHLALQVIGSSIPGANWNHTQPFPRYIRRLWPFVGSFKWPPGDLLNLKGLEALANHWVTP